MLKPTLMTTNAKKKMLNVTYSVDEIDIDIKRPVIEEAINMLKLTERQEGYTTEQSSNQQILIEQQQSKVTITNVKHLRRVMHHVQKHSSELSKKITVGTNNLPMIVVSDWDLEQVITTESPPSDRPTNSNHHIAPRVVEEITVDQFQKDLVSLNDRALPSEKITQRIVHKSASSYSNPGSYIIVKNGQPADVNFELFDSIQHQDTHRSPHEQQGCQISNYYLKNDKIYDQVVANLIEENNLNHQRLTAADNVFENDEYNLYNFKHLKKVDTEPVQAKPVEFTSVTLNSYLNEPKVEVKKDHPVGGIPPSVELEDFKFYYFYCSGVKCQEIFNKRCIALEKVFYEGRPMNGIVLLTLPPGSSDNDLLLEIYGSCVPYERTRVECCIKFRREILDKSKQHLTRISPHKFICKKRIEFSTKFPKHEFRYMYNK